MIMILFSWVLLLALFSPFPLSFLNPSLLLLILKLFLISVLLLYLVKMERKKKNIEDHVLQHSRLTKRKQPQGGSDRLSQHGLLVTAELQLRAALLTLLCFSVYESAFPASLAAEVPDKEKCPFYLEVIWKADAKTQGKGHEIFEGGAVKNN